MPTLEKHYTLEQAVRTFFADAPITVSTLRSAIKKRKLQATMPEGKLLVTEAWLVEWLSRCRVTDNLPDCGSSPLSAGEQNVWIILDGSKHKSTGCSERDIEQAQRVLADYIRAKYEPPTGKGQELLVVEAVAAYLEHHVAHLASVKSRDFGRDTCRPLLQWWSGKTIAQVNGINCRAYVKWRIKQTHNGRKISDQTARHDLKSLRAALRWYKREVDSAMIVPTVTMPSKAPPRLDYFLTRDEMAMRLRAARKSERTHHVARMLLIGWYTGTRPGAILALRWLPSPTAGWFDLNAGVLHRRGSATRITNKRQPPARIHARLLPHLRRWHKADTAKGFSDVIRYHGEQVTKLRSSWASVARRAAKLASERETKRTGRKVEARKIERWTAHHAAQLLHLAHGRGGQCVRSERLHGRVSRGPARSLWPPPPCFSIERRYSHQQASEGNQGRAYENGGMIAE